MVADWVKYRVKDEGEDDPRSQLFRRNNIPADYWYKVTSDTARNSSGNPYYFPTEWGIALTNATQSFDWIKTVADDCGGFFISPEDLAGLEDAEPEKALKLFQKIIGVVKKRR